MKNLQLILKSLMFSSLLFACTGPQKSSSSWAILDGAKSVSCELWPKPTRAISITEVWHLPGSTPGFITTMHLRNGAAARAYAPFLGDEEIEVEQLEPRRFGQGTILLGGFEQEGKSYVGLVQKSKRRTVLELRTIKDNVVRHTIILPREKILAGKLKKTNAGLWVLLSIGDAADEQGIDDAPLKPFFIPMGVKAASKKLKLQGFAKESFPSRSRFVAVGEQRKIIVMSGHRQNSDPKSFRFFIKSLDPDTGKVSAGRIFDAGLESAVESWNVIGTKSGFMLAYIDGDSLVGQAQLKIQSYQWNDDYEAHSWTKAFNLANIHVSEPLWLESKAGIYLLLPKWVDGESTVAVYPVSETIAEEGRSLGVLPSNLRIIDAVSAPQNADNFILIRYRKGEVRQFELCNLGSF